MNKKFLYKRLFAAFTSIILLLTFLPVSVLADSLQDRTIQGQSYGLIIDNSIEIAQDPLLLSKEATPVPNSFDISTSEQYSKYFPPNMQNIELCAFESW